MGDREEVPDRGGRHLLERVRGGLAGLVHEAQHDVGRGCERNHSLRVRNVWYFSDHHRPNRTNATLRRGSPMTVQVAQQEQTAGGTRDWHRIFDTLPDEHDYVIDVIEGRLPETLVGTLYRNGPAKNEVGGTPYAHLFDGDAMLSQL